MVGFDPSPPLSNVVLGNRAGVFGDYMADPLPFDAPDDQPVDLLFVLLVPAGANQEHLDILAEIARLLSQDDICRRLRAANDAEALYEIVSSESL